jgi:DNA polymerase elongation subunit (family B)
MYQACYYSFKDYQYHLRDDEKGWSHFNYGATYYKEDPNGSFLTLEGKKVSPTKKYNKEDRFLYEKDVDKVARILVDLYYEDDEPPKYHNVVYFDVECEIVGALTPYNIENAIAKMTSLSLYDVNTKTYYCWIVDHKNQLTETKKGNQWIIPCGSEETMMNRFLNTWQEIDPTIISGWNSAYFDVPYIYYRIKKVLGEPSANRLSPIGIINIKEFLGEKTVSIAGINHLDYMLLHKKFITKQEPSYRLESIGEKYVNLGKVDYNGSLDRLFEDDIQKFIDYNIRDVEIIDELEKKLKFIELTVNICHLCHTTYENIYYSTALNDAAILTYLKRKKIVSPNKPTTINPSLKGRKDNYAGGYLKDPIPGLYEWVIDLDFTSLYPSIIRSLNIGIETYIGRIVNDGTYDNKKSLKELKEMDPDRDIIIEKLTKNKEVKTSTIKVNKLVKYIESNGILVAASGALFDPSKESVVCEVLSDWFAKRVEYKTKMKEAYKSGDEELGEFYNKRQHAYKIKLNDVYGVFAQNGWRYTDGHKRISSAITLTGQRVTQESITFVNKWMNEKLGTDKDYVVTSDTDSLFLQLKDLIQHEYPDIDWNDRKKIIQLNLEYTAEIQKLANEHLNKLVVDLFNITDREHYFELKQEVVLERGYFAGKRRYAMFIVNKEGVDTEELVMMGLDMMKSNFPPMFKEFGGNILQDIMFGKTKKDIDTEILDFRDKIDKVDWKLVTKPTGLKKMSEYISSPPAAGQIFSRIGLKCPINTKSAIRYNDLLKFKKLDKKYPALQIGDKMLIAYLKENPYKIDAIGFNGYDDAPEILEFIEKYLDKDKLFNSMMKNKLQSLYDDLGWGFPVMNKNVNAFFNFI